MPVYRNNTFPSQEDQHLFANNVPRYIEDYVNHFSRLKPPHSHLPSENYTMARYISQKDDPFTGMKNDQISSLPTAIVGDMSELRDPRDLIQQAHKGVHRRPAECTSLSVMETTQEHSDNKGLKTVASYSTAALTHESGVGDFRPEGSSSGIGNIHTKEGGRSNFREKKREKRSRPDESFISDQGLYAEITGRTRREAKPHVCHQCGEKFQFDARLR